MPLPHPTNAQSGHGKMRKRPIIQMNAVFKQIKPGALSG
jgi:hypothetical protein